ncbi:MAG: hypothetical protein RL308_2066 [Bacteroidota bacterium]|jgi:hypothetical protein
MKTKVLMSFDEPSDIDLSELMFEVSKEAKAKALIAQKQLNDRIILEINIAQSKHRARLL